MYGVDFANLLARFGLYYTFTLYWVTILTYSTESDYLVYAGYEITSLRKESCRVILLECW